jgi:hypothetical protein
LNNSRRGGGGGGSGKFNASADAIARAPSFSPVRHWRCSLYKHALALIKANRHGAVAAAPGQGSRPRYPRRLQLQSAAKEQEKEEEEEEEKVG